MNDNIKKPMTAEHARDLLYINNTIGEIAALIPDGAAMDPKECQAIREKLWSLQFGATFRKDFDNMTVEVQQYEERDNTLAVVRRALDAYAEDPKASAEDVIREISRPSLWREIRK